MTRLITLSFLAAALVAPTVAEAAPTAVRPYSKAATKQCLKAAGRTVSDVRRVDSRRMAFRDLAQRTSLEVRFGKRWIALAFTPSAAHAAFLRDALRIPNDPYTLRVRGNVVLMFDADGPLSQLAAVERCLR